MSGHNKWSKIKHKKAATDGMRSKIFSRYSKLITMESSKVSGNVNSPVLATIIERAKKESMPKDNIERAVKKGTESDSKNLIEVVFETYGPGGTAILISCITDNNNRTAPEIKNLLHKAGLEIASPGSASWAFTKTEDGYVANSPLPLSEIDQKKLDNLIEIIEDYVDVDALYTNALNK